MNEIRRRQTRSAYNAKQRPQTGNPINPVRPRESGRFMEDTILLVDDEEGIRKVLGISLSDSGYTVHTAAHAQKALEILREVHPGIVLTDIKMPDMDGIRLLQEIKRESPETEVIMITGQGDMQLAIQSMKNDAVDFVTKPIDDEVLDIAIQRARERISMRRQIRRYTQHLEQLVEEKTRRLLDAERMAAIGETIAEMAHTIKNIAAGLRGGMFVLSQGIEENDRQCLLEGWEMVRGNVDKIRRLSLDLLDYGKFADANLTPCNPCKPAEEAVTLLADRADEHGVNLQTDLASGLQPYPLDAEAMQRCLVNLIANAIDACREVAPDRRQVRMTASSLEDGGIEYRVSDTGCGMTPEVREKIFQRFFSSKGTAGTGIGLMMARKIVEQHGGRIDVETEPDRGSTFTVRLPAPEDAANR